MRVTIKLETSEISASDIKIFAALAVVQSYDGAFAAFGFSGQEGGKLGDA